jgi:hypothetical protein
MSQEVIGRVQDEGRLVVAKVKEKKVISAGSR